MSHSLESGTLDFKLPGGLLASVLMLALSSTLLHNWICLSTSRLTDLTLWASHFSPVESPSAFLSSGYITRVVSLYFLVFKLNIFLVFYLL